MSNLQLAVAEIIAAIEFLKRYEPTDELLDIIRQLDDVRAELDTIRIREEIDEHAKR